MPASTTACARSSRSQPTMCRSAPIPTPRSARHSIRCAPVRTRTRSSRSKAGRSLAQRRAGSAVWFDFATLCDGPRSQRDYLELARRFSVLFLSGIPRMSADMGDRARRFTWLVDILYDHRVKLLASAATHPDDLYRDGPNAPGIQPHGKPARRHADARVHGRTARRGRKPGARLGAGTDPSRVTPGRTTTASPRRLRAEIQGLPDVSGKRRGREPLRRNDAGRTRPGRCRGPDQVLDDQLQGRAVAQRHRQDHAQVPDERGHRHGGHRGIVGGHRAGSAATR